MVSTPFPLTRLLMNSRQIHLKMDIARTRVTSRIRLRWPLAVPIIRHTHHHLLPREERHRRLASTLTTAKHTTINSMHLKTTPVTHLPSPQGRRRWRTEVAILRHHPRGRLQQMAIPRQIM